jgi:hypothetical protein
LVLLLLLLLGSGCAARPVAPNATPRPAPAVTPAPIPTPTLTPTATPIPPVPLIIRRPVSLSALEPFDVAVELPGLAERDPGARIWARVVDPLGQTLWEADLERVDGPLYRGPEPVRLPLLPPEGDWWLIVFVRSQAEVSGSRVLSFRPDPVAMHDLSGLVRPGIGLQVPQAFVLRNWMGDATSGGWMWDGGGGRVELWWLPGPAEPLTEDTARMVVEASLPEEESVGLPQVEPVEWGGQPGFRFREEWSDGPGEAVVVQGPDRWLYLIRVRAFDGGPISPLLRQVQATFRLVE